MFFSFTVIDIRMKQLRNKFFFSPQERTLILDQSVKIGRSVARARPATNNAIFDCKVLSRNHALLWYENGKVRPCLFFMLYDNSIYDFVNLYY